MIGHGASEFGLDFLTSFFPQSAVSARVFVSAGQVPRLLESLKSAVRQLEQRQQAAASGPTASVEPVGEPPTGTAPPTDAASPNADGETPASDDDGAAESEDPPTHPES